MSLELEFWIVSDFVRFGLTLEMEAIVLLDLRLQGLFVCIVDFFTRRFGYCIHIGTKINQEYF